MKTNEIIRIVVIGVIVGVIAVVVLKALDYDNASVVGGAIAGAVAGTLAVSNRKKKKE